MAQQSKSRKKARKGGKAPKPKMGKGRKSSKRKSRKARTTSFSASAPPPGGPIDVNELSTIFNLRVPGLDLPGGNRGIVKICEVIRQNPILKEFERNWNEMAAGGRAAKLLELIALRQLSDRELTGAFGAMGVADGTLRNDVERKHIEKDWLGGYFKGPVGRIFLEGMILGAQRSIASNTKVAMYWVAGAGRDVKVSIAQSGQQTTFLLMTPSKPGKRTYVVPRADRPEPLYVVSAERKGVVVEQVYQTVLAPKER